MFDTQIKKQNLGWKLLIFEKVGGKNKILNMQRVKVDYKNSIFEDNILVTVPRRYSFFHVCSVLFIGLSLYDRMRSI